jgi:hypothetical protein
MNCWSTDPSAFYKQRDVYAFGDRKCPDSVNSCANNSSRLPVRGGSYKTVADRSRIAERFSERLSELNIQIRDVKHIKTSHIEKYIESRKADVYLSGRYRMRCLLSVLFYYQQEEINWPIPVTLT